MVWLPDGEKNENTITRSDRMYERDRQTDRRTPHDGIGRACIASRGKKDVYKKARSNSSLTEVDTHIVATVRAREANRRTFERVSKWSHSCDNTYNS